MNRGFTENHAVLIRDTVEAYANHPNPSMRVVLGYAQPLTTAQINGQDPIKLLGIVSEKNDQQVIRAEVNENGTPRQVITAVSTIRAQMLHAWEAQRNREAGQ
jgi:hypothetical protein